MTMVLLLVALAVIVGLVAAALSGIPWGKPTKTVPLEQLTGPPPRGPVFTIDDTIHGPVDRPGETVVVEQGASVVGDITAETVKVEGQVTGTIRAKLRAEFGPNARFEGVVKAPRVSVSEGADFQATSVELASG